MEQNPFINLRMKEEYSMMTRVFLSNKVSSTITIPVELARKYRITVPNYVQVFDTIAGILVKPLRVKSEK